MGQTETMLKLERSQEAPTRADELGSYEIILQTRIAVDADVIVLVRGALTPQAIDKLVANLNVIKESLEEEQPPQQEARHD